MEQKLTFWDQVRRVLLLLACFAIQAFAGLILFTGWSGVSVMPIPATPGVILFTVLIALGALVVIYFLISAKRTYDFFHGHEKGKKNLSKEFINAAMKDVGIKS